jgi:hypothetical protein
VLTLGEEVISLLKCKVCSLQLSMGSEGVGAVAIMFDPGLLYGPQFLCECHDNDLCCDEHVMLCHLLHNYLHNITS